MIDRLSRCILAIIDDCDLFLLLFLNFELMQEFPQSRDMNLPVDYHHMMLRTATGALLMICSWWRGGRAPLGEPMKGE
ncbi:hypothetical protein ACS0TY_016336 [Phlomoides rotata]